jgi:hypothetical protein
MKIIHYYRYDSYVAEVYGLPLAEIETRYIRGDYPIADDLSRMASMSKMYNAGKVWRKIDNEPITIIKSRDGNNEFDEHEFIQMLFLAEIAGPVSLGA